MQTISVKVQADHLEGMTRVKRPILAIAELIWNSVDADATLVKVIFDHNALGSLERIHVVDNGLGMPIEAAFAAFGNLGGSWKRQATRSPGNGRLLHGRAGKGRFRAFSIGEIVEWTIRYEDNGAIKKYQIRGLSSSIGTFQVDDEANPDDGPRGTEVSVSGISKNTTQPWKGRRAHRPSSSSLRSTYENTRML
jgi:HSP90 family molecular chaperone